LKTSYAWHESRRTLQGNRISRKEAKATFSKLAENCHVKIEANNINALDTLARE